jgi:hypothetical protein
MEKRIKNLMIWVLEAFKAKILAKVKMEFKSNLSKIQKNQK